MKWGRLMKTVTFQRPYIRLRCQPGHPLKIDTKWDVWLSLCKYRMAARSSTLCEWSKKKTCGVRVSYNLHRSSGGVVSTQNIFVKFCAHMPAHTIHEVLIWVYINAYYYYILSIYNVIRMIIIYYYDILIRAYFTRNCQRSINRLFCTH